MGNNLNNFRLRLIEKIKQKKSIVCVGIDPDLNSPSFPKFLLNEKKPKLSFAKMLIDEIEGLISVIKPNTKFYQIDETEQLRGIVKYAHQKDLEVIGDCKENDIGNTMAMAYEKQFSGFNFDAITVNGYFGQDGIIGDAKTPIYKKWYEKGKGLFVLIKTSNQSSKEIQDLEIKAEKSYVYAKMANLVESWSKSYDFTIGGVAGATHSEHLKIIRDCISGILLIPGFGAQGGRPEDINQIIKKNKYCIVNSSRGVMYAYKRRFKDKFSEEDFAQASKEEVIYMNKELYF